MPSPVLPKLCQIGLVPFLAVVQPSPAQPSPAQPLHPANPGQPANIAKAVPKAFLPDSDASFSAAGMLRFWSVFGLFGAAVQVRFRVVRGWLWGLVFGAEPSSVKGFVSGGLFRFSQPSPAQPSPAQPAQHPGQLSPAPRQPQHSPRALPKPCQRFSYRKKFLTGFRRIVLGRRNASFWVRFWPVWGRRAAAFPCCEGVALGPGFWCPAQSCQSSARSGGLFRIFGAACSQPSPAQPTSPAPSPAPRPAQPSTHTTPAQPAGIAKAVPKASLSDSDASFSAAGMLCFGSVFGLFGAAVPLRFPVVRGWLWGLVFGAQPSPAKALPDRAVCSVFGAARLGLPCPAQPGPTQPSPASPGQQPGQPSPAARQPQPSPRFS